MAGTLGPFHNRMKFVTVLPSTPNGQPIVSSLLAPGWWPALILIGIASIVFGIAFWQEIIGAVRVWIDSTAYNHCFLVLPLAGFLLWERRAVITSVSPRPALWPLLTMPALSAIWLVAAVLDIQEGRQLFMVAMFQVVLLVALGPRAFWQLLAPFLFLFFSRAERRIPRPFPPDDYCRHRRRWVAVLPHPSLLRRLYDRNT